MEIDWTQIILAIIGILTGGTISALVTIKYARRKANIEVKSDSNKEQSERIDLGDKYVTNMLQMLEKIQEAQNTNTTLIGERNSESKEAFANMEKKMNEIHGDLVGVKDEVTSIVSYLNGGYQKYKNEHHTLEVFDNLSN
jgi:gas vesicle protein